MRFIAKEGVSTKHTPRHTEEAILVSYHLDFLSGVSLSIRCTKDGHFIVTNQDQLEHFTSTGSGPVADCSWEVLQKHQIGNSVKKHGILSLETVLELFSSTEKMLVLELDDIHTEQDNCISLLLDLLSQYPNINLYLKSSSRKVLSMLEECPLKSKVGITIQPKETDWDSSFDFYVTTLSMFSYEEVKKKIDSHLLVMVEDLITEEELLELFDKASDLFPSLFILSSQVGTIYEAYVSEILTKRKG